jgi:hypothetical protein
MVSLVTPIFPSRAYWRAPYLRGAPPARASPMSFLQRPRNTNHNKRIENLQSCGTHILDLIVKVSRETFFSRQTILSGKTGEFLLKTPKYFMKVSIERDMQKDLMPRLARVKFVL